MKIVAISDTHTLQDKVILPDGQFDVLIHCGDMGNVGKVREYKEIGAWFLKQKDKFKHRIMIAGNHDWGFMQNKDLVMECFDEDMIYLEDRSVIIDGVKFYGTPWMPEFCGWAFMKDEIDLPRYYANIDDDTDVLITHCPPKGILDRNVEHGDTVRCGSTSLADRIKDLSKLKHHVFGHIHGGAGQMKVHDVTYHNVASLNEFYRYQNPPQVFEI